MLISEILEQVKHLAADAAKPEIVCWVVLGEEDNAGLYCPDCAKKILAWVRNGDEQPNFGECENYPICAAIDRSHNYIFMAVAYAADCNIPHCEHCGCLLESSQLSPREAHSFRDSGLPVRATLPMNIRVRRHATPTNNGFSDACRNIRSTDESIHQI